MVDYALRDSGIVTSSHYSKIEVWDARDNTLLAREALDEFIRDLVSSGDNGLGLTYNRLIRIKAIRQDGTMIIIEGFVEYCPEIGTNPFRFVYRDNIKYESACDDDLEEMSYFIRSTAMYILNKLRGR